MYKDECILLDEQDNVTGHSSKYDAHRFTPQQPTGLLHRAFSVFLFSQDNKLLLQQRALTKITFPSVWTNTCCSHPLHGYSPSEVDSQEDVHNGQVLGAKQAAIRKLNHELGISAMQLPIEKFKFLTRLHYCAPDSVTYSDPVEWGEHEIDYILFIKSNVDVAKNPEEVEAFKYVTKEELQKMMDPTSGLLWSPWFRIIAENFLYEWWDNLDQALTTDKYVDTRKIHKI